MDILDFNETTSEKHKIIIVLEDKFEIIFLILFSHFFNDSIGLAKAAVIT